MQTLRWEEPASPYFKTNFQEPHARLNPGMTAAIVVFFFPKSTEEYFSTIPFRTARVSSSLYDTSMFKHHRIDYLRPLVVAGLIEFILGSNDYFEHGAFQDTKNPGTVLAVEL